MTASVASSGGSAGLRWERSGTDGVGFLPAVFLVRAVSVAGWAITGLLGALLRGRAGDRTARAVPPACL
jgi:hypothetical protein